MREPESRFGESVESGQFLGGIRKRIGEIVEECVDSILIPALELLLRAASATEDLEDVLRTVLKKLEQKSR